MLLESSDHDSALCIGARDIFPLIAQRSCYGSALRSRENLEIDGTHLLIKPVTGKYSRAPRIATRATLHERNAQRSDWIAHMRNGPAGKPPASGINGGSPRSSPTRGTLNELNEKQR
jgi:hypothetical protein